MTINLEPINNPASLGDGFSTVLPFQKTCIDGVIVCTCAECHEVGFDERVEKARQALEKSGTWIMMDGAGCSCCRVEGRYLHLLSSGAHSIEHAAFRESLRLKKMKDETI